MKHSNMLVTCILGILFFFSSCDSKTEAALKTEAEQNGVTVVDSGKNHGEEGSIVFDAVATINDTNVRLRTEPNLESETIDYLNTGDEVVVLSHSVEQEKIDTMEAYWYSVQTSKGNGWVYGYFIDILQNAKSEIDSFYVITQENAELTFEEQAALKQKFHPISLEILTSEGETFKIGQTIPDSIKSQSNTKINNVAVSKEFGELNGYTNDEILIGWNYNDAIIYIEVLSDTVQTIDGFSIGSDVSEVIEQFGEADSASESKLVYENTVFERLGYVFEIQDDVIQKIIMYVTL